MVPITGRSLHQPLGKKPFNPCTPCFKSAVGVDLGDIKYLNYFYDPVSQTCIQTNTIQQLAFKTWDQRQASR